MGNLLEKMNHSLIHRYDQIKLHDLEEKHKVTSLFLNNPYVDSPDVKRFEDKSY